MSVKFRCWYCRRKYTVAADRIGKVLTCNCQNQLRVPKRDGGNSRIKTPLDWLIEIVVCGGGGAFLGFCLALFIVGQFRIFMFWAPAAMFALFTLVGFAIGALGGMRGINWIGQKIRGVEERWQPIAQSGDLCPTSRTSLAWPADNQRGWPIKPDIVMEGGNYAQSGDGRASNDDLSMLTTILHPSGRLLDTTRDTSPASTSRSRASSSPPIPACCPGRSSTRCSISSRPARTAPTRTPC